MDRPLRSSAQRLRSFGLGVPISGGENTIGRSIKAFKPARGQVRAARRFAQASMALWGLETSAVVAVVDELAQNAVVHARSRFVVTLRRTGASVRVEVRDQDPRLPYLGTTHLLANSGRGLVVVEQLSLSWGAQPAPGGGKTVWAEVQVVPDPSPRPALAIGGHKSRPDWWDHLVIPHQVGAPGSAALIGEGPSASVG